MDSYVKAWLQFVFPVYVFILVGIVILFANLSQHFANLLSNRNPVATLATLILLSYTKLLQSIMTIVAFTTLEYRTETETKAVSVWREDANVVYFERKHIPLFIVSLIFLVAGTVFTGFLLFWQCIQCLPNRWLFRWIKNAKLNAFMDAYVAPYSTKYRFWPGLLFLARASVLFVISGKLFVGSCVVVALIFFKEFLRNGIYKNWLLNTLENSFFLKLDHFYYSHSVLRKYR